MNLYPQSLLSKHHSLFKIILQKGKLNSPPAHKHPSDGEAQTRGSAWALAISVPICENKSEKMIFLNTEKARKSWRKLAGVPARRPRAAAALEL